MSINTLARHLYDTLLTQAKLLMEQNTRFTSVLYLQVVMSTQNKYLHNKIQDICVTNSLQETEHFKPRDLLTLLCQVLQSNHNIIIIVM